jgi:phage terminase large subunit-like protein
MIDKAIYQKYAANPMAFIEDLRIDCSGEIVRFGDVIKPYQRTAFENMLPGLMRCIGREPKATKGQPLKMRAWLERPRGHSKTTDIAVICCFALAFSTRKSFKAVCFAGDRDQARILRDAVANLCQLNLWLASLLRVDAQRVVNIAHGHKGEGSVLEVWSADPNSSWGLLVDLVVADEVSVWEGDGSLWHSLISSAAKRANAFMFAILNAGWVGTPAFQIHQHVKQSPDWYFSSLDGPEPGVVAEATLEDMRGQLPLQAFNRIYMNIWASPGGDALRPEDIDAAFQSNLKPLPARDDRFMFVAGVDLGVTRDASAIAILAVRNTWLHEDSYAPHGRIRLAYARSWHPTAGRKVNLQEVEDALLQLHYAYGFSLVMYDPWQATHAASRLKTLHDVPMEDVNPSGNNHKICAALLEAFNDRRVDLYPEEELRRDLLKFRIEERPNGGFKLTSPRDKFGHGDLGQAFALAVFAAQQITGRQRRLLGAWNGDDTPDLGEFGRRQAEYEREMRTLAADDDGYDRSGREGWHSMMQMFGRGNY